MSAVLASNQTQFSPLRQPVDLSHKEATPSLHTAASSQMRSIAILSQLANCMASLGQQQQQQQ
jgi:hypothetical protein